MKMKMMILNHRWKKMKMMKMMTNLSSQVAVDEVFRQNAAEVANDVEVSHNHCVIFLLMNQKKTTTIQKMNRNPFSLCDFFCYRCYHHLFDVAMADMVSNDVMVKMFLLCAEVTTVRNSELSQAKLMSNDEMAGNVLV